MKTPESLSTTQVSIRWAGLGRARSARKQQERQIDRSNSADSRCLDIARFYQMLEVLNMPGKVLQMPDFAVHAPQPILNLI
jgi:hypothetical protein